MNVPRKKLEPVICVPIYAAGNKSLMATDIFDMGLLLSLFRRALGTKQSEHRPSLHRFISTYSWPDAEDEKCDPK